MEIQNKSRVFQRIEKAPHIYIVCYVFDESMSAFVPRLVHILFSVIRILQY